MGKIFGTDGIRSKANQYPMTAQIAQKLGIACADVFRNSEKRQFAIIGQDTRWSCDMISTALMSGLCSNGFDVILVGTIPTPGIAFFTRAYNADLGFVVSASHNPAFDNGIKIFSQNGFKISDTIQDKIESIILSDDISTNDIIDKNIGKIFHDPDAASKYIEYAKKFIIKENNDNLKIVIDCANGAASSVAPEIFKTISKDLILLNIKPDGTNINDNCGATKPYLLQQETIKNKADIGIAFDGDADRIIICDENGHEINGDQILAICGIDMLKKDTLKNNAIVATEYSNLGLDEAFEKNGGNVIRVLNGDRYVIEKMKEENLNLGGEASGHIVFMDSSTTGDGIISAVKVLNLMIEKNTAISELAKCISLYPQVLKSINVKSKKDFNKMPSVKDAIESVKLKLNNNGRLLIRYSGTENKARIMIEGKDKSEIEQYACDIANKIKNEIGDN